MKLDIILILFIFKLSQCYANEYNILELLARTLPQFTYESIDPNLLIKFDASAIRNWTIGNEFTLESTFRVNKADFSDYPIYNFFTFEHDEDRIVIKGKNYGKEIEIDYDEAKMTFTDINFLNDRLWHNLILIFSRTKGYAEVSFDCHPPQRVEISKEYQSDEIARQSPLIVGIPKLPVHSADILRSVLVDKVDGRWDINCAEYSKKFSNQSLIQNALRHERKKSLEPKLDKIVSSLNINHETDGVPSFDQRFGFDSCEPSKTTVKGQKTCQGELIFEDNFDLLNFTKWDREIHISLEYEDAGFLSYQEYLENLYVSSGSLKIIPRLLTELKGYTDDYIRRGELNLKSRCTGIVDVKTECIRKPSNFRILPPIISGKIRTKNSFSFRYGTIEVRAKLPKGDWIFPQILLEPLIWDYGITEFRSGQMRIAFTRGNEILFDENLNDIGGNLMYGGVVLSDDINNWEKYLKSVKNHEHYGNRFHVYSLEWTDQSIKLSIDGKQYDEIIGGFKNDKSILDSGVWKKGDFMAPFDKEFYLSLGVSVGGIFDFPDNSYNWSWDKNKYLKKPWNNTNPKAELNFWRDRFNWLKTWNTESKLEIDYIRVWAL